MTLCCSWDIASPCRGSAAPVAAICLDTVLQLSIIPADGSAAAVNAARSVLQCNLLGLFCQAVDAACVVLQQWGASGLCLSGMLAAWPAHTDS